MKISGAALKIFRAGVIPLEVTGQAGGWWWWKAGVNNQLEHLNLCDEFLAAARGQGVISRASNKGSQRFHNHGEGPILG